VNENPLVWRRFQHFLAAKYKVNGPVHFFSVKPA
jgi:hypothetical protein